VTRPVAAIVCDFDGVIADSETIANRSLAACISGLGVPTTFEDCLRDYCGHNWRETERRIGERLGEPLPAGFRDSYRARTRALLERELVPVAGVERFLAAHSHLPLAVASSSGTEYLHWALAKLGLARYFGAHVYSAEGWERGKPFPDIYLHAARGLGVAPESCLAIEDSPVGARAALAAGMRVIGLVAAGHIADPAIHVAALRAAGIAETAFGFAEIEVLPH
jgi:HAD superfamily hydrolase (TIGR01509 family)